MPCNGLSECWSTIEMSAGLLLGSWFLLSSPFPKEMTTEISWSVRNLWRAICLDIFTYPHHLLPPTHFAHHGLTMVDSQEQWKRNRLLSSTFFGLRDVWWFLWVLYGVILSKPIQTYWGYLWIIHWDTADLLVIGSGNGKHLWTSSNHVEPASSFHNVHINIYIYTY